MKISTVHILVLGSVITFIATIFFTPTQPVVATTTRSNIQELEKIVKNRNIPTAERKSAIMTLAAQDTDASTASLFRILVHFLPSTRHPGCRSHDEWFIKIGMPDINILCLSNKDRSSSQNTESNFELLATTLVSIREEIKNPKSIPLLQKFAQSSDIDVAKSALEGLSSIDRLETIQYVYRQLVKQERLQKEDGLPYVLFSKIRNKKTAPFLIRILRKEDPQSSLAMGIIEAIQKINKDSTINLLIEHAQRIERLQQKNEGDSRYRRALNQTLDGIVRVGKTDEFLKKIQDTTLSTLIHKSLIQGLGISEDERAIQILEKIRDGLPPFSKETPENRNVAAENLSFLLLTLEIKNK